MNNKSQLSQTISIEVNAYTDPVRTNEIADKLRAMMVEDGPSEASLTTHFSSDNKPEYPTAVISSQLRVHGFDGRLRIELEASETLMTNNLLMVEYKRKLQAMKLAREVLELIASFKKEIKIVGNGFAADSGPAGTPIPLDQFISPKEREDLNVRFGPLYLLGHLHDIASGVVAELPK
ncbi:hypothetical protein Xoosp14_57 [Xanthomonas phage Xoo-sp14]|nr:hypothetical protein Xoosp14_57 [Xanthomonas phage Xoo-sp14]